MNDPTPDSCSSATHGKASRTSMKNQYLYAYNMSHRFSHADDDADEAKSSNPGSKVIDASGRACSKPSEFVVLGFLLCNKQKRVRFRMVDIGFTGWPLIRSRLVGR